MMKYRIYP